MFEALSEPGQQRASATSERLRSASDYEQAATDSVFLDMILTVLGVFLVVLERASKDHLPSGRTPPKVFLLGTSPSVVEGEMVPNRLKGPYTKTLKFLTCRLLEGALEGIL